MSPDPNLHCPADRLEEIVAALSADDDRGLAALEQALLSYGGDERLQFLHGSILAGRGRYDEARAAMERAVALQPDYAVARYQLGFLNYTSGDAMGAETVWRPLLDLDADDPLRAFAEGLLFLARDDFPSAKVRLHQGITLNVQNPAMNRDIRLILDRLAGQTGGDGESGEPTSAADMLLRQSQLKPTRH